ncbi:MAG: hypothetical protein IJV62_04380 [Eggerthellaceae bacterium]|nr:hypothetical protein [Eggerthellaceae bacterium]
MKKTLSKIFAIAGALILAFGTYLVNTATSETPNLSINSERSAYQTSARIDEYGSYTSKEDVAAYIHMYERLPENFISKTKAHNAGWNPEQGNLNDVMPGKSIGGSIFHNDDKTLPSKSGRVWHECDVNYHTGFRGSERIVYSNDGLIFYTPDHYKTFEQLY